MLDLVTLRVSFWACRYAGLDLLHDGERVSDVAVGGVGDFLKEDIKLIGREAAL